MDSLRRAISTRERGAALIIVLAFVVLLTGVSIAYLSRATSDRQVAHGSFNEGRADQLAASAMDNIIGDLRQEITNGSTARTVGSSTVYVPTSSDNALPVRAAPNTIPNLLRRSVRSDGIPSPALVSRASAVNSTSDPSANQRSVGLARWNKHYLVARDPSVTDPAVTTPISDFAAPDWVFVKAYDPITQLAGATVITSPDPLIIGRYAYAIYDEGGLLDVNVAGYPSFTSAAQYGRKGASAFADLSVLGLSQAPPGGIDTIVGWRNFASAQYPTGTLTGTFPNSAFTFSATTADNYVKSVLSNTDGFMGVRATRSDGTANVWESGSGANRVRRTDQIFADRQSLIAMFRVSTGFNANALQYLGTFSRERNAPSWKPSTPAGSTIDYANLATIPTAETSTAINRDLLSVRVNSSFTRFDGTSAIVGEPLIKRRFPLSRLAWITYKGPSAAVYAANSSDPVIVQLLANNVSLDTIQLGTAVNIQKSFGLIWVPPVSADPTTNRWNYVGASGSTVQTRIERLDEVTAENREPNFFELLKATILSGSAGVGSGPGNTFVAAETKYYDTNNNLSADTQVMQIGSDIIDQADPDKNPTSVAFGTTPAEFTGVENLPYLNKIGFQSQWTSPTAFSAFLVPSFWNPSQIPSAVGTATTAIPTVRFVMTSGTASAVVQSTGSSAESAVVTGSSTQPSVNLTASAIFNPPDATLSTTAVKAGMVATPNGRLGIPFTSFSPAGTVTQANATRAYPKINNVTFEMQAQIGGSSGPWKTYQRWFGSAANTAGVTSAFVPPVGFDWAQTTIWDPEFVLLDPRTMRFGAWESNGNATGDTTDFTRGWNETLDRTSGGFQLITGMGPQGSWFTGAGAEMGENTGTGPNYTDQDMRRRGDYLTSGATSSILPTNSNDRPQILNRPFQSVAEIGQVFRDEPWKTLNFTTADSADAGLLDAFTLHESSLEAGKTSLNTRQPLVAKAILSNAIKRLAGTSADLITPAQRDNIVTALTNLTTAQPMINKAELVTRLAADSSITGLGNKEARECVIRAFSDACQTRTWNVLIDVIAQSGRYPPNATSLANGFVVEGEQRYWVHVAIDRFTGEVIDKQIEVVNE